MDNVMNNAAMNQVDDLGTRLTALDPKGREVRTTIDPDGKQWWVAKDVCDMLGYADSHSAVKVYTQPGQRSKALFQTKAGLKPLIVISEPVIYALILGSRKPEAETFSEWVEAMLFSDRRHPVASYMIHMATGEPLDKAMDRMSEILPGSTRPKAAPVKKSLDDWLDDPDAMIEAWTRIRDRRQAMKRAEV